MTVQSTSRRALLKGTAMLAAVPVAALGGVPVFDVVGEEAAPAAGFGVGTFEQRIRTAAAWFDLTPPALAYNPEDLAGGPLLTDELLDWMRATGRR